MPRTVLAFITDLQRIPNMSTAAVAKEFRFVCKRHNYKVMWLCPRLKKQFCSTVVTPGKCKLFVKRLRPISICSERKKLNVLIPRSEVIGLPKIYGITDDWVIYKYIVGAYSKPIKRRIHLFEAVDHLLHIHAIPCANFVQHSFFQAKVIRPSSFLQQVPQIAKTIGHYGAPAAASEQLLMLLDSVRRKTGSRPTFSFSSFDTRTLAKYDFVLCHGGYIPRHLFRTPQGLRVVDWEAATLFSRWYDVLRLAPFVSAGLTDVLWSRYVQGYLAK